MPEGDDANVEGLRTAAASLAAAPRRHAPKAVNALSFAAMNYARRKKMSPEEEGAEVLQLVEFCLESENLVPLVRFVFDRANGDGADAAAPGERGSDPGGRFGSGGNLRAAQKALQQIITKETAIISNWCNTNAAQMGSALDSVGDLMQRAGSMEHKLQSSNQRLQAAGAKVIRNMRELQEAVWVAANVSQASDAVARVLGIVRQLVRAVKHLQNSDLHSALAIIQALRAEHTHLQMYPLPPRTEHEELGKLSAGEYSLMQLTAKAVQGLMGTVKEQARRDFHTWLTNTRVSARMIGERAVRRAAGERAHEEALARERKILQGLLLKNRNLQEAKQMVLDFIADEDPSYGRSSIKLRQSSRQKATPIPVKPSAPKGRQQRGSVLAQKYQQHSLKSGRIVGAQENENAVSLLEGVDMKDLHRCIHVHTMLGDLQAFKEYYHEQRQLQLLSDLAAPASLLEHHKAYLGQITGFFITEENVLSSTIDLLTPSQVQGLWHTAILSIKHTLDTGFDDLQNAAAMLLMKDFILLTGGMLAKHNFDVSPMTGILLQNRERYHDLLNSEVAVVIKRALRSGSGERATIATERDLEDLILSTGLPATLADAEAIPELPFTAPFTRSLPSILTSIEGYISDSVQFLRGLVQPFELLSTVREQRDRFVGRLVTDLFANHTRYLMHADDGLVPPMLMVANVHCLAQVLKSMDDYTVVVARGSGELAEQDLLLVARTQRRLDATPAGGKGGAAGAGDSNGVSAMAQGLRNVQGQIERYLHGAMAAKIKELVAGASEQPWAPEKALPAVVSPYLENMLIALQEALQLADRHMPAAARGAFAESCVYEIESELTCWVLAEARFPAWNVHGMRRLHSDLEALARFVDNNGGARARAPFAGLLDLASFLGSQAWHRAASPQHLFADHPNIDALQLAVVLKRYVPEKLGYMDRLSASKAQPWARWDVLSLASDLEAAISRGDFARP